MKSWFTRILGWGMVAVSALLVLLARISEADIVFDPPQWLRRCIGLLLEHWKTVALVLIGTGGMLLIFRAYRRYAARAHAQALLPIITENLKRVENQISLYLQAWKFLEDRVNNRRFHRRKKVGPWWEEAVERLNGAYRGFEDLAEQLFYERPDLPPPVPRVPPEISHVRPDSVRRQFKELWSEHQQRMVAISIFREYWNRELTGAIKVLEQDVRRAASARSRRKPLRRAPSSEAPQ